VLAGSPEYPRPRARSRKSPLWARLCVIFGAIFLLGSGVALAGTKVVIDAANRGVNQKTILPTRSSEQHVTIRGPKTILLIGVDARPGEDPSKTPIRADSIMLLHVAASHDRAYIVSIPRDTYVRIPAQPATRYAGNQAKINAAFAYGGLELGGIAGGAHLLAKTIESISGVVLDAAAVINFAGFQKLVGVLGGVDMCIDEKVTSIHIGHTADGKYAQPYVIHSDGSVGPRIRGVTPEVYLPGCRHLVPWQALDYVRQRDLLENNDYDYGRQRHQQQFIKAVFKEIASAGTLTNFGKRNKVLGAMRETMTVDGGGISPADWVYAMRNISPDSLLTIKTNAGKLNTRIIGKSDYQILSPESIQLLQSVRDDTMESFIATHPDWVSKS
jgi:LCP family protein required for cell wall assembly